MYVRGESTAEGRPHADRDPTRAPRPAGERPAVDGAPRCPVRLTPPGLGGPENPDDGGARAVGSSPSAGPPCPDAPPPRWLLRHAEDARSGDGGGVALVDRQVRGPRRTWHHEHAVEAAEAGTTMADRLEIELPRGLSALETLVERSVRELLAFRARQLRDDLAFHARWDGTPRRTIAFAGASGLIGTQLAALLTTGGHTVLRMVRGRAAGPGEIAWDPSGGRLDPADLEDVDAVVNLGGRSIAPAGPPRAGIRDHASPDGSSGPDPPAGHDRRRSINPRSASTDPGGRASGRGDLTPDGFLAEVVWTGGRTEPAPQVCVAPLRTGTLSDAGDPCRPSPLFPPASAATHRPRCPPPDRRRHGASPCPAALQHGGGAPERPPPAPSPVLRLARPAARPGRWPQSRLTRRGRRAIRTDQTCAGTGCAMGTSRPPRPEERRCHPPGRSANGPEPVLSPGAHMSSAPARPSELVRVDAEQISATPFRGAAGRSTAAPEGPSMTLRAPERPARRARRRRGYALFALFAFPNLALIAVFAYWPILANLYLSLTSWDFISPEPLYVGLTNYTSMLASPSFHKVLWVSVVWVVVVVGISLVLGVLLALLFSGSCPAPPPSPASCSPPRGLRRGDRRGVAVHLRPQLRPRARGLRGLRRRLPDWTTDADGPARC